MLTSKTIRLFLARTIVVMDWYVALAVLMMVFLLQHQTKMAFASVIVLQGIRYLWEGRLRRLAPNGSRENEKAFIRTVAWERILTWFLLFNVFLTALLMPQGQGTFIVYIIVGSYVVRRLGIRWSQSICYQHYLSRH